ncbi:MAG: Spo0E like sporulation regulatory protein [Eubacterium sp.]|nr:Spo0E like sporulation regulatory protein [Eubacterium sp.]
MDTQDINKKIELTRRELALEYTKCMDGRVPSPRVLEISEELDKLILEYMKIVRKRLP